MAASEDSPHDPWDVGPRRYDADALAFLAVVAPAAVCSREANTCCTLVVPKWPSSLPHPKRRNQLQHELAAGAMRNRGLVMRCTQLLHSRVAQLHSLIDVAERQGLLLRRRAALVTNGRVEAAELVVQSCTSAKGCLVSFWCF